jgi:hypothetical protein
MGTVSQILLACLLVLRVQLREFLATMICSSAPRIQQAFGLVNDEMRANFTSMQVPSFNDNSSLRCNSTSTSTVTAAEMIMALLYV